MNQVASEAPAKRPRSSSKRRAKWRNRMAVIGMIFLAHCAYHPRIRPHGIHPLQYDHMHSRVALPWRTPDEFNQYFELSVGATIVMWSAFPYEFLTAFSKFDLRRLATFLWPPSYHLETREQLQQAIENEKELIENSKRQKKGQRLPN